MLHELLLIYTGAEYSILSLSTTEPVMNDIDNISIDDSTKSLNNPYVFNTAISRARDCVIASGNPFILLKIEKLMEKEYPGNMAKCWSSYLKHCLEKGTVLFDSCLAITDKQKGVCLDLMRKGVEEQLGVEVIMDQNLLQVLNNKSYWYLVISLGLNSCSIFQGSSLD